MAEFKYKILENLPKGVPGYSESDTNLVSSFEVNSTYNFRLDRVDLHFLLPDGTLIESITNYDQIAFLQSSGTSEGIDASEVTIDVIKDAQKYGYEYGGVQLVYNFLDDLYSDSRAQVQFYIAEISQDRTEVRLLTTALESEDIIDYTTDIKEDLEDTSYFNDFKLNFGNNNLVTAINIDTQIYRDYASVIVKLYQPLPEQFGEKSIVSIDRVVNDTLSYTIEAQYTPDTVTLPTIKGPNFAVQLDSGDTVVPSEFFNYNELFNYSTTNSYRELASILAEKGVNISIDYSEFSDFIHFSSAQERLRNFKYKLDLIESYQEGLTAVQNSTATNTTGSVTYYTNLINGILENFDHFDRHLYYQSGSTSWPKTNNTLPYINATGAITGSWYYSSLDAAETYDISNTNQLLNAIPTYLREDTQNAPMEMYVHMIAQHFDNLWIYTKAVTDKYDNDNRLEKGISRDLVEDALRNFGIKLYTSNNSLQTLFKTFTGEFYATGSEQINTFITGSNNPVPEEVYRQEIYKRLYHNLPLLTKAKGTERGLRALINSFGIPTLHSSGSHSGLLVKTAGGTSTVGSENFGPNLIVTSSVDKIRIDNTGSVIEGDSLSQYTSIVRRDQSYTDDFHGVEIGYSPTDVLNNAIISELSGSGFNIDNYIGDPSQARLSSYTDLISAANTYVNQVMVSGSHNLQDFTRILKFYDNVIFKTVKDFIPARSAASTGVIIKSHLLERNKAKQVTLGAVQNIANSTSTYFDGDIALETVVVSGSKSGSHAGAFTGVEEYSAAYSESVMTLEGPMLLDYHTHEEAKFDGELSGSYLEISTGELNDENIWKYNNPYDTFYKIEAVRDCNFSFYIDALSCDFSVHVSGETTPTPVSIVTPTPSPTPTPPPNCRTMDPTPHTYTYDASSAFIACTSGTSVTVYTTINLPSIGENLYTDTTGCTPVNAGYYSNGTIYFIVDKFGEIISQVNC